jgi:tRNA 2-selenouridine synthase
VPQAYDIEKFLSLTFNKNNVVDVRSPGEFAQGHIPGAISVPLFSNEERAIIGTIYKQRNRQEAVLKGLEIVGPKLQDLVKQCVAAADNKQIFVHCWRGGMRSGFVATLLEMYGLSVVTLKHGYKAYRTLTLNTFGRSFNTIVLGGKTGSGKTRILKNLNEKGEQVIDLEGLAHHKGSAFGGLGEPEQPTQEQFENGLAYRLLQCDESRPIWLEDESRMIGKKVIPGPLWDHMRNAKVFYLQIPFEERLKYIVDEYGKYPVEGIEESINKISRRMGPEQTKNALLAIKAGDIRTAFDYCLHYYDKAYQHGLSKREPEHVEEIFLPEMNIGQIADTLIQKTRGRI